jgi:hypothetical protein
LLGLQRERIALLEGFDDKRVGFEGLWLAHNAILEITREKNGKLKAVGSRWFQGDWKAGCDYDISGRVTANGFRVDGASLNPDTLEREHATLIVNRADDEWAKTRSKRQNTAREDEQKCKRRLDVSSTARLFPVRRSPDIKTEFSIR